MIRLVLLRLLESYFRHRWLYLLPLVLMMAAVGVYLVVVPAPYIAEGTLYVQQETLLSSLNSVRSNGYGFQYVTPANETVGELYQLVSSDGFMRAVIQQTDLESQMAAGPKAVEQTITEARSAVWFQSLGNNLVLISAKYTMPRVSTQLVSSIIETYTRWKTNISHDESVAAHNFFTELVATYQADLELERKALTNYLVLHPEPVRGERSPVEAAEIAELNAAVNLAEERLRSAENKEEDAKLALAQTESNIRQSYFVVDAPQMPLEPKRSKKEMAMIGAIFMLAGAFFTIAGIVGNALLDRSLRFPIDVTYGLNHPVLALIPEEKDVAVLLSPKPVARTNGRRQSEVDPLEPTSVVGNTTNGAMPKREHPLRQIFGSK